MELKISGKVRKLRESRSANESAIKKLKEDEEDEGFDSLALTWRLQFSFNSTKESDPNANRLIQDGGMAHPFLL